MLCRFVSLLILLVSVWIANNSKFKKFLWKTVDVGEKCGRFDGVDYFCDMGYWCKNEDCVPIEYVLDDGRVCRSRFVEGHFRGFDCEEESVEDTVVVDDTRQEEKMMSTMERVLKMFN